MGDQKLPAGADGERRASTRHFACSPSYIDKPDGGRADPRVVMIQDVSVTGARLLTRDVDVEIGERLELDIYASEDPNAAPRSVGAEVVRVQEIDFQGLWTHAIGVRFTPPLDDFEAEIEAIAARQAKLFPNR